jgi:hypothetical protein
MTINEKRVSSNRHFWTCLKVESKEQLRRDGASTCKVLCCSGSPHKNRDEICRKWHNLNSKTVWHILKIKYNSHSFRSKVKLNVFLTRCCNFVEKWGTTGFKEDLDIRDLVGSDSYYYDFYDTDQTSFSQSLTVSLTDHHICLIPRGSNAWCQNM